MALTAISPWSVMISTWGLESNVFPSLFVFTLFFLVKALKKPYKICFSAAIFSLCLYSYGSAYVAVPVFLLLSVIFIIKNKLIPIKWIFNSIRNICNNVDTHRSVYNHKQIWVGKHSLRAHNNSLNGTKH